MAKDDRRVTSHLLKADLKRSIFMEMRVQKFLKNKLRLIFLGLAVVLFCLLMALFPSSA